MKRMTMGAVAFSLFLAGLQLCAFTNQAHPQIAMPQPIVLPVSSELQVPLRAFLREFGVKDVEALLGSAKMRPIAKGANIEDVAFRLEDKRACTNDLCLTILATIKDRNFVSHAMLFAGKLTTNGDVFGELAGAAVSPPTWFMRSQDDTNAIAVIRTAKGWVVIPPSK